MSQPGGLALLDGQRLQAIGGLWQRQRRRLDVTFGGVSMLPSIRPGEPLSLVCDEQRPRSGDVIAFVFGDQIGVHRLVARTRDGQWLITAGDAHRLPDAPVRAAAVIGVVHRPDGTGIPAPRSRTFLRAALALALVFGIRFTRGCIVGATALERSLARLLH